MYSSGPRTKPLRWAMVLLVIYHVTIIVRSSDGPDFGLSYNLTSKEHATINLELGWPGTSNVIVVGISYIVRVNLFTRVIKDINCMRRNVIFDHHLDDYKDHCLGELFKFSHQKDMDEDYVTKIYCKVQNITLDIDRNTNRVTIANLLPNQSYQFNVTIATPGAEKPYATMTHSSCNPPGYPQYPPQADYPTFDIFQNRDQGKEGVILYWRPVPQLLSGDDSLEYELVCTDETIHFNDSEIIKVYGYMGSYSMSKPINATRICNLTSLNNIGHNTRASQIIIPAKKQRINLGRHFKLSIVLESNQKYKLEWNPIADNSGSVEVLPRNHTVRKRLSGNFMIYWCVLTHSVGCKEISGMVKLNTSVTSYTLELPEAIEPGKRTFGFSYSNPNGSRSTGIIWSKCGPEKFEPKPVKIILESGVVRTNHSIPTEWFLPICDSEVLSIISYQIEYCRVSSIEGYDVIWRSQPPLTSATIGDCWNFTRNYSFMDKELIDGLNSSTRYNIRMRYMYNVTQAEKVENNETVKVKYSDWSNVLSAYTEADPETLHSLWWGLLFWVLSIIITTSVVGSIIYMKARIYWLHSKLLVSRFTQTRANLGDTMIGFSKKDSELSLRYCINKASSEMSLSMLDSDEGETQTCRTSEYVDSLPNQQSFVDQTFEYLPRKLFEGNQDEGTVESCSDSVQGATKFEISSDSQEADDISIDSHSSFLNTLLNEQSDLNNNRNNHNNMNYGNSSI